MAETICDSSAHERHQAGSDRSCSQGETNLQIRVAPQALEVQRPDKPDGQARERDQRVDLDVELRQHSRRDCEIGPATGEVAKKAHAGLASPRISRT